MSILLQIFAYYVRVFEYYLWILCTFFFWVWHKKELCKRTFAYRVKTHRISRGMLPSLEFSESKPYLTQHPALQNLNARNHVVLRLCRRAFQLLLVGLFLHTSKVQTSYTQSIFCLYIIKSDLHDLNDSPCSTPTIELLGQNVQMERIEGVAAFCRQKC